MAQTRIMWTNLVDSSTITASSEDSALPGANIANALRTKVWRSGTTSVSPDAATQENIVIDMGSAKSVTSVILLDHDLTALDTGIALEGNASDSWGAPSFTQALTRVGGPIAAYFASQSYRYWRITYTKEAASQTRDIGRVFIGTYDQVPITGMMINKNDLSKMARSIGGQTFHDVRPNYDEISLQMGVVSKAVFDTLNSITESVGVPLFVSVDNDVEHVNWLYYVKIRSLPNFNPVIATTYWQSSLSLNEQL